MTRFICCVGFILTVSVAFSQKVYFVYLESESQQPFFAKIRDKTFNSSTSGYLILSSLRDSSYTISIGFPGDKWPEQQFTIPIRSKDRGFMLKNFGEKGWGLYDLQTLSIQMPDGPPKSKSGSIRHGGVSAFTALLSKAANDPSLLESPALAKNDNKPDLAQHTAKNEDVNTEKVQLASTTIAAADTKKEVPDSQKGVTASNTATINQTGKEGVNTQKEQAASNTIGTDATKKEVPDSQKVQTAPNAVAINQTRKEGVNTQNEKPASNPITTSETRKEAPDSQKVQPAANSIASADQAKKEVADTQKGQPVSSAITADQTKKKVTDTHSAKPSPDAIAIDQTKKVDSLAATAKINENKTTTTSTGEQQKKQETAVATTTAGKPDKSSGAPPVSEKQEAENTGVTTTDAAAKKPAAPEKYKRSLVTKKSESSTTDGFGLVFIDQVSEGQRDTIEIFIPNPKEAVVKKNEQAAPTRKFLDIGNDEKNVSLASPAPKNKSCSSVAVDKDFFNLRKKMAAQKSEEAMINESRKSFKSKCYTTEQIKNLGSLFLKESGKFQFYEAAYPFSSDQGNFIALQSDFKDNYFIYRFKKLVN